jgi:hypothetical protein
MLTGTSTDDNQLMGNYLPLSPPRRIIADLVHFAKRVPSVPVEKKMDLSTLAAARRQAPLRIGWPTLFIKAFALTALTWPQLRRAYLSWPWPRLYEHNYSVASVAIEREFHGESAVFFAHVHGPEFQSLPQIEAHLRRCKEARLEELGLFRRALMIGRLPGPIRRFMWWHTLEWSGIKRAKRLGTFGFSTYASLGASSLHPLSPLTTTLNYGVFDANGQIVVRLIYDHRVMDGATVARALVTLEQVLGHEILEEIQHMKGTTVLSSAPRSLAQARRWRANEGANPDGHELLANR